MEINKREDEQSFFKKIVLERLDDSSVLEEWKLIEFFSSFQFILNQVEYTSTVERDFYLGIDIVKEKTKQAVDLYRSMQVTLEDYGVESISGTFKSFNLFFDRYDVCYGAHLTPGVWIDYQLSEVVDDKKYQGIDFVMEYLTRLKLELDYLSHLPERLVYPTLEQYSKKLGFDYKIDVNNIYDIIFNQMTIFGFLEIDISYRKNLVVTRSEALYLLSNKHQLVRHFLEKEDIKETYYRRTLYRFVKRLEVCESIEQLGAIMLIEDEKEISFLLELVDQSLSCCELLGRHDIKSIYDLYDALLMDTLEDRLIKKIVHDISLEEIIALLLLLKRDRQAEWKSTGDVMTDNGDNIVIRELKKRIASLDISKIEYINHFLMQAEIQMLDFN